MAISKPTRQGARAVARAKKPTKADQLLERIRRRRASIEKRRGMLTESYILIRGDRER